MLLLLTVPELEAASHVLTSFKVNAPEVEDLLFSPDSDRSVLEALKEFCREAVRQDDTYILERSNFFYCSLLVCVVRLLTCWAWWR